MALIKLYQGLLRLRCTTPPPHPIPNPTSLICKGLPDTGQRESHLTPPISYCLSVFLIWSDVGQLPFWAVESRHILAVRLADNKLSWNLLSFLVFISSSSHLPFSPLCSSPFIYTSYCYYEYCSYITVAPISIAPSVNNTLLISIAAVCGEALLVWLHSISCCACVRRTPPSWFGDCGVMFYYYNYSSWLKVQTDCENQVWVGGVAGC